MLVTVLGIAKETFFESLHSTKVNKAWIVIDLRGGGKTGNEQNGENRCQKSCMNHWGRQRFGFKTLPTSLGNKINSKISYSGKCCQPQGQSGQCPLLSVMTFSFGQVNIH
jgi:hypothetical protein